MWVRNGGKSQLGHSAPLGRGWCHLVILTKLQRWVRDSGRFIHMCKVFVLLQVVLLSLSLKIVGMKYHRIPQWIPVRCHPQWLISKSKRRC